MAELHGAGEEQPLAERRSALPDSARLPVILLVALLTALVFHGVFWVLWTYLRGLI